MGMGLPGDVLYFHRAGIAKIVGVVDLHARFAQTPARLITPSLGDDEDWVGMR